MLGGFNELGRGSVKSRTDGMEKGGVEGKQREGKGRTLSLISFLVQGGFGL